MTTVWDRDTADWIPALQDQVGRARQFLGDNATPGAAAAYEAERALRQTSDALMVVLAELGVETPLGWRLHQLRSRLDAHLLAASAFADADANDAMISVLRRSLDVIGAELEALQDNRAAVRATFPRGVS